MEATLPTGLRRVRGRLENVLHASSRGFAGEPSMEARRPPVEDVLRISRPLVGDRVPSLSDDVRAARIQTFEKGRVVDGRCEQRGRGASIEMEKMCPNVGLELDGQCHPVEPGRAGERPGSSVDAVKVEIRPKTGERL